MEIGTDISPAVCKKEGYLMMSYRVHSLIVKGELQKDVYCDFYQYYPDYCLEEKGYTVFEDGRCMGDPGEGSYQLKVQTRNGEFRNGLHRSLQAKRFCARPKMMDESYSAQDIWEMYQKDKLSIDTYTGFEWKEFPKLPHDLLHLASDVSGYSNIMNTGTGDML